MTRSIHVLGAGIVGICTAVELARRGFAVTLVDRREPARETSWGNAGVIAAGSIFPEASPELWRRLPGYLFNRGRDVHVHYRQLPRMLPYLRRFAASAGDTAWRRGAASLAGLLDKAVDAHMTLVAECGAHHLVRRRGWLKLYRSEDSLGAGRAGEELLDAHGISYTRVDRAELAELEPHLAPIFAGGRLMNDVATISDPGALGDAYASLLARLGGAIRRAEVRALEPRGDGWRVLCDEGTFDCDAVVVALGAWSRALLARLGSRLPLIAERGYHRHFCPAGDAALGRPIHDIDGGYVLAPMDMGYRLTTGVEWARLDAPPTPVQLSRVLPRAREAFPLGEACSPVWLGNRPQTPDTLPLVGPVPRCRNLWLASGHGHLGLSLGPITGVLLAQRIAGEPTAIDLAPFDPARFVRGSAARAQ